MSPQRHRADSRNELIMKTKQNQGFKICELGKRLTILNEKPHKTKRGAMAMTITTILSIVEQEKQQQYQQQQQQ